MTKRPVVIIQGYGAPTLSNIPILMRLKNDGFNAYSVPIPGINTGSINETAKAVADTVTEVKNKHQSDVDLIGVSMGGLIGLYYIRKLEGHKYIRKFITLGTPFSGTPLAHIAHLATKNPGAEQMKPNSDFIKDLHTKPYTDCEIISIRAQGDMMVSEKSATLEGARLITTPHGIWPIGHYTPILLKKNYEIIESVLSE